MTRNQAVAAAVVAGYHNDRATFTRLCIEQRVKRETMTMAWHRGERAKKAGVKCTCQECAE